MVSKSSKRQYKKSASKKNVKGGAIFDMETDFTSLVYPTLPEVIVCPLCNEKHKKKRLLYDVNSLRSHFRSKYPKAVRVRSYKLPTRRRYFMMPEFTGTVFYITCHNCSFMMEFRNQRSENLIRQNPDLDNDDTDYHEEQHNKSHKKRGSKKRHSKRRGSRRN